AVEMKIYDKQEEGYIEVWFTNEEQQIYDRAELTKQLLSKTRVKKCKVVYFLSGYDDLYTNTEGMLLTNLGCA
ncbi:MAG: hypothetical protein ACI4Q5_03465, partial [Porcipelethomonas sp.]